MNGRIETNSMTERELVVYATILAGAAQQAGLRGDRRAVDCHAAAREACLAGLRARADAKATAADLAERPAEDVARFPLGDHIDWGW